MFRKKGGFGDNRGLFSGAGRLPALKRIRYCLPQGLEQLSKWIESYLFVTPANQLHTFAEADRIL